MNVLMMFVLHFSFVIITRFLFNHFVHHSHSFVFPASSALSAARHKIVYMHAKTPLPVRVETA
jgi:hypothetical protein